MECADSYVAPEIKEALKCLDHAYRLYGPESVICSYNGGKDAVVILHLLRAAHAHYFRSCRQGDSSIQPCRPRAVYFDHKDEFPEVLSLLHSTVGAYDLDMVAFEQGVSFSDGLKTLVDNNFPEGSTIAFPMAFVLGTRSSDPNSKSQGHFAPSSHYMPPFMRVNPILEWTYGHVWHFLRLFQLPYCCLYDMGYTSLGTVKDTRPCPALAVAGASTEKGSVPKYWPAYMLRDWDQERAGRIKKETKKKSDEKPSRPPPPGRAASTVSQYSTLSIAVASTIVERDTTTAIVPPASHENGTALSDLGSSVMSFSCNDTQQRTVGLLIIGAEILKGLTVDTNTNTAAKALWGNNVLLNRVVVVSDDPEEIIAEVCRLQAKVDVIITSGGVGPTHDDVTIKSVAAALDRKMVFNEEMAQLLREKMNTGDDAVLTEAQIKMATLPANCTLRYLSENKEDWPVLQCRNVFVLPGVPEFFSKKVESLAEYLSIQLERSVTYKVVLSVDEASIVNALNAAVERHPHVTFGSYPFVSHPDFKTVLTLEGRMLKFGARSSSFEDKCEAAGGQILFSKEQTDFHVQVALDELIDTLPEGSILRVDNNDGMLFL
jgi:FAD synthetase